MNTETTETTKGWVFYDAECAICRRWVGRTHGLLTYRGLHAVPLQAAWAKQRLCIKQCDPLDEMKFLAADGRIFGGADGIIQIARRIWWAWPFFVIAQIPGLTLLLRKYYRRLAANRYCRGGKCRLPEHCLKGRWSVVSAFYELP